MGLLMARQSTPKLPDSARDLQTARLRLIWLREGMLRALIVGTSEFTELTGWTVAEEYMDFPGALEFSLEQWEQGVADPDYWMYLTLLEGPVPEVIGLIGFKGGPDARASVEIGYSMAPQHRNLGYATEATECLTGKAMRDPRVKVVMACTLAEVNASTRVLEKNGFRLVEEITDPEEGSILRWELSKSDWRKRAK